MDYLHTSKAQCVGQQLSVFCVRMYVCVERKRIDSFHDTWHSRRLRLCVILCLGWKGNPRPPIPPSPTHPCARCFALYAGNPMFSLHPFTNAASTTSHGTTTAKLAAVDTLDIQHHPLIRVSSTTSRRRRARTRTKTPSRFDDRRENSFRFSFPFRRRRCRFA